MDSVEVESGRRFFGRFDYGADAVKQLTDFVAEENIQSGVFNIIGAVQETKLGYYDQERKEYVELEFKEPLEVVSCMGNVSWMDCKPVIHAHACLSRRDGSTVGGHVNYMKVFAGEFTMVEFKNEMGRLFDDVTGLNLLRFL